jgi:hypothetical protein
LYPRFEICVELFAVNVLHWAAREGCHLEILGLQRSVLCV